MTLVVGFHATKNDTSGLALGARLARSSGQDLRVVTMVPAPWPRPVAPYTDRAYADWAKERGEEAAGRAERLLAEHCPDVPAEAVWVAGRSVPGVLTDEAERVGASMIVVGSGPSGVYGRVNVHSTAETLLHSSPVPVALATRGYRLRHGDRIGRVTLAFRGDDMSRQVLATTARLCTEVHAALRLVTFAVAGKVMYPPTAGFQAEDDVTATLVSHSEAAQKEALDELTVRPDTVECVVAQGSSWAEAVDGVPWVDDEVLVVGSSQVRGLSRLFLGSTATKIARNSPVPVIVVP